MLTLTDFLLARIAEDEAAARVCKDRAWDEADADEFAADEQQRLDLRHIARHDPARVLAECEAKRRIVEATRFDDDPRSAVDEWLERPDLTPPRDTRVMIHTLRALASIYADHPDYREEWRP